MSTGYQILVMLHLLCVIGGFGAVSYNALYINLAQRRPGAIGDERRPGGQHPGFRSG